MVEQYKGPFIMIKIEYLTMSNMYACNNIISELKQTFTILKDERNIYITIVGTLTYSSQ